MSAPTTPSIPSIELHRAPAASIEADAVIVGVVKRDDELALLGGAATVDSALSGGLLTTLKALGFKAKADEVSLLPTGGSMTAPVVAAVGVGKEEPDNEALRRAAGSAVRQLAGKAERVAIAMSPATTSTEAAHDIAAEVGALAEGALLGAYTYDRYRSGSDDRPKPVSAITILTEAADQEPVNAGLRRAQTVARAVYRARDWVNTAPADLYPGSFADAAQEAAASAGVTVEVLDEQALADRGYGGNQGVGQGSSRPPRLVRLHYRPDNPKRRIAFVGKGITFDTGGISLKPHNSMVTMKCDMAGAASVIAATIAIAELGLPVEIIGYAAMAENMPSGTAQRPSDVLTIYGGKTVEVLNTDAEGRLVMADAIVRAGEDEPDLIVDVATLTGACMVALGLRTFGIMSSDDELSRQIGEVAARVGEDGWPLPIPEGMREGLESKVADLANISGDRYGGALVAAAFLREFVPDGVRWAHLDIAGPAFNEKGPRGYTPAGGTGCGVRTLVGLAETAAAGDL